VAARLWADDADPPHVAVPLPVAVRMRAKDALPLATAPPDPVAARLWADDADPPHVAVPLPVAVRMRAKDALPLVTAPPDPVAGNEIAKDADPLATAPPLPVKDPPAATTPKRGNRMRSVATLIPDQWGSVFEWVRCWK